MKFTQVPADTWQKLQLNAGIMVDEFTPSTGKIGNVMGATTGGFNFSSNPTFTDFGEDVDNVPANTWQLKRIQSYDPSASGTFLTVTPELAAQMVGAAGIDTNDPTHIIPAEQLKAADFTDVWVVGDYSDVNTGNNAGFIAIHLKKALNTSGFQMQTSKNNKGKFSVNFHGHYDLTNIEDIPFELYVKAGS